MKGDDEEIRKENEYTIKIIREMCARHSCESNILCRALVNIGKFEAWEDGIKSPISASVAQLYNIILNEEEDNEDEDMMENERKKDANKMETGIVVDEGDRSIIIL